MRVNEVMDTASAQSARRVGLISDTHGKLRSGIFSLFDGVDAIVHAGDVGDPSILTELSSIAPVYAVHGNTDGFDLRAVAPASLTVELGGRRIVVVHGHLVGTHARHLRAAFPDCDVIVYGHTHQPLTDAQAAPLVVNPGAAGPARFNLKPSVAILALDTLTVDLMPVDGS
jgi:uncharacterized protein